MIEAIIFDLGNVIVPFDHRRIFELIDLPDGMSVDDTVNAVLRLDELKLYQLGLIATLDFLNAINSTFDLELTFEEFSLAWNSSLFNETLISLDIIENLAKNYRLLLLSDTNELHFEYVKKKFPMLLANFETFVLSFEVGFLKPSREIFEIAVEKSGYDAYECCFIDDLLPNVAAANGFGIRAVHFSDQAKLTKSLRDLGVKI